MKRTILTLFLAIMATTGLYAQQISVVSPGSETSLYRTLGEAIQGAEPGSVIYLPGGGFTISDDVKITKKLTIIGIGHKSDNDNVDGVTTISGNLFFNEGSSGSAVLGCYITGNVNIGEVGASVNDILIRYCNVSSIIVKNTSCLGTVANQNYFRGGFNAGDAKAEITNNIIKYIYKLDGGSVINNVITGGTGQNASYYSLYYVNNSDIFGNIALLSTAAGFCYSNTTDANSYLRNMGFKAFSREDDFIDLTNTDPNEVFVNYNNNSVSPTSNFHFTEAYKQYENQVGIYAGTGFNDQQIAPVPYIVAKRVDEQTDASGKLNVKIRVKAGQ